MKLTKIGNYRLCDKTLGKGNFARVELARHTILKVEVAIKIIDVARIKEDYVCTNLEREARMMARVWHPNIIRLYETVRINNLYCIVVELVSGGDLHSFTKNHKDGHLCETRARHFTRQLVSALAHLHSRGVVHRDLKMENIMLNKIQTQIKIVDFGLSNICTRDTPLRTHCGSPKYAAPELFELGKVYGPEIDVWSLGVILFAMLVGRLPFLNSSKDGAPREERTKQLLKKMKTGLNSYHMKLLGNFDEDCLKLIRGLLEPNPANRLTMTKVISDSWLTEKKLNPILLYSYPSIRSKDHNEIVSFITKATNQSSSEVESRLNPMKYDSVGGMYTILSDLRLKEGDSWDLMRRGSSADLKREHVQPGPRRTVSLMNNRVDLERWKSGDKVLWPHSVGVFSKFHDDMLFTSTSSSSSIHGYCSNTDCSIGVRKATSPRKCNSGSAVPRTRLSSLKAVKSGLIHRIDTNIEKEEAFGRDAVNNKVDDSCCQAGRKSGTVRHYKSFEGLGSLQNNLNDASMKSTTPHAGSFLKNSNTKAQLNSKIFLVRSQNGANSAGIQLPKNEDKKESKVKSNGSDRHESPCPDDSEETDTSINVIINSEKIIRHVTNLLQQSQALKVEGKNKDVSVAGLSDRTSPLLNAEQYYNPYPTNINYLSHQGPHTLQNYPTDYENAHNSYTYGVTQKKISSSSTVTASETKTSSDAGNDIFHKEKHRDNVKYNKPITKPKSGNSKQDNYRNFKDRYSPNRRQSKKSSKHSKSSREKHEGQDTKKSFWRNSTSNGSMGVKMVSNKSFGPYCLGNGDYFRELQRDTLRMSALQNQMFVKPYIEQKFLRVFPCHQSLLKTHPKSTSLQLKTISDVRQMVKYT